MYSAKKRAKSRVWNRKYIVYLGLVVIIAVVILLLELTDVTHFFHKSATPAVIPVETPTIKVNSSPTDQTTNNSTSTPSSKDSNVPSAGNSLPLYAPYGDFVSNHSPNLSGQPAPSSETSVCNTTPGASCYIRLTKGSSSTVLPAQTTNSKGFTAWTWDVKKAGLTVGQWTITAVATLNGQTKSTQDQIPLSVGQ